MEWEKENNIFKYATKELSQDAFICWLINWYNYKDSEMYSVAEEFLNKIIEKSNKKDAIKLEDYDKIDVKKQHKNIDVLINLIKSEEVKKCIIIEDKTFTKEHNEQISKYKKSLGVEYKNLSKNDFITVYYKMIDYKEKSNADIHININDMLDILSKTETKNNIYLDYKDYLKNKKDVLDKFEKIPFNEWKDNREIYEKFISEYKEKGSILDVVKDVQHRRGGIYIDFDNIEINKNKVCEKIYFCLNFMNKEKCCLDIRARYIKKYKKDEKTELSKKIREELEKLRKEDYNIYKKEISQSGKEAKQTMLLVKVLFNEKANISNCNLYKLPCKLKRILENKI